jgi:hypothetical protein
MGCPGCPESLIIDPPQVIYTDTFHPQIINVIHPIEIINRDHCVPVTQHFFTVNFKDEFCSIAGTNPAAQIRSSKKKRAKR